MSFFFASIATTIHWDPNFFELSKTTAAFWTAAVLIDTLSAPQFNNLLISSIVNIPVIASGGVGNLDHLVDGIKLGKASAVLAASIFHYGKYSVKDAKEYLDSKGIPARIKYVKYIRKFI